MFFYRFSWNTFTAYLPSYLHPTIKTLPLLSVTFKRFLNKLWDDFMLLIKMSRLLYHNNENEESNEQRNKKTCFFHKGAFFRQPTSTNRWTTCVEKENPKRSKFPAVHSWGRPVTKRSLLLVKESWALTSVRLKTFWSLVGWTSCCVCGIRTCLSMYWTPLISSFFSIFYIALSLDSGQSLDVL